MRALLFALALAAGCYVEDAVVAPGPSYPYGACEIQANPTTRCEDDYFWIRGYYYHAPDGRLWWQPGHYRPRPRGTGRR